jgi:hypothetical protein
MIYAVGGKIIARKKHPCGGNEWQVMRTGADIKLKCLKCGKAMFLTVDQTSKMAKEYCPPKENDDKD